MNVKSVEKETSKATVTVELTRAELEPAINKAYLKYRKDIAIPGFRKGKAPRVVIEAAYGKHVPADLQGRCSDAGYEARRPPQRFRYEHRGR